MTTLIADAIITLDAITTLTKAARTASEDFAQVIAGVLASVAANVGGVDELLAGRPGSWEADLVRRLVEGTIGVDATPEELLSWRTEPVRVVDVDEMDAEEALRELGWTAREEAAERVQELREKLLEAHATPEEWQRVMELREYVQVHDDSLELWQQPDGLRAKWAEIDALITEIEQRGEGSALAQQLHKAEWETREDFETAKAKWRQAVHESVRQELAAKGCTAPVEFVTDAPWDDPLDVVTLELRYAALRKTSGWSGGDFVPYEWIGDSQAAD